MNKRKRPILTAIFVVAKKSVVREPQSNSASDPYYSLYIKLTCLPVDV